MWGVTMSSMQTEGVHPSADWSRWERDKTAPDSSDGNGFATNFHDDLSLIASIGVTDVRLGIEWARIEPVEGKIDSEALDRYGDMVAHARSVGVRPWLTLHSTSLQAQHSLCTGMYKNMNTPCFQLRSGLVDSAAPVDTSIY